MTRRSRWLVPFVLMVAGCTDSVDSISREYRNTNNEAIDALMMVTSNTQAKRMTTRVFKPLEERYGVIDKKLQLLMGNRDNKEFVKEVFESDSFHLYLTELDVNRQRFALEMTRLRNLLQQYEDATREREIALGNNDPKINLEDSYPELYEVVHGTKLLSALKKQLEAPELVNQIKGFPSLKVDGYEKALFKTFKAKREAFGLKREFVLVIAP